MRQFTWLTEKTGAAFATQSAFAHIIVYAIRAASVRKVIRGIFHRLKCVSRTFDAPTICDASTSLDDSGRFSHAEIERAEMAFAAQFGHTIDMSLVAYDVYLPTENIAQFAAHVHNSTTPIDTKRAPFVYVHFCDNAKIPHGMGKLSPLQTGSSKRIPIVHTTGRITDNSQKRLFVIGKTASKPKAKPQSRHTGNHRVTEKQNHKPIKRVDLPYVIVDKVNRVSVKQTVFYTPISLTNRHYLDCTNGMGI